ncbi:MAG: isoprenylcysteine carboxylmethyltransferase family protein [Bacilli bacterium]|nr:isoprenylcysteine carboxylmethyltransferase family protein [Bacilli bacterium]
MILENSIKEMINKVVSTIGIEETIINYIIILGILLIYLYVLYNFISARFRKNKKKKEVKSIVETASMSAFFAVIWLVVFTRTGVINFHNTYLNIFFLIIYVIGIATNLLGRFYLGKNWGNNVVIYEDHTFVHNGVYKIVRHPLYASIIWMIYSISFLKSNYLVFILNTIIFIPFMYYRAKQEEKELIKVFKEYNDYIKNTGMFFPKIKVNRKEK